LKYPDKKYSANVVNGTAPPEPGKKYIAISIKVMAPPEPPTEAKKIDPCSIVDSGGVVS